MDETDQTRLRGLVRLVHEGVSQVATRVEHYHRRSVERVFFVLEAIEPIAPPARAVHRVFDLTMACTYGTVRVVNQGVAKVDDWALSRAANDRP